MSVCLLSNKKNFFFRLRSELEGGPPSPDQSITVRTVYNKALSFPFLFGRLGAEEEEEENKNRLSSTTCGEELQKIFKD